MRRIQLSNDDHDLFNTELSQTQFDFFQKHEAAFRRMYEEQGKDFWVRYIMTFRSFTNKHGYLKDFPHKKHLLYLLDFAFITIHEKFVDAKFKDTKTFISDIVTIARHRGLASYCETKKCMNGPRSKNPFFVKETKEVFRGLFGSQNDEQSYLKALILIPLFLRYGGSVMICLRRWLDAPPMEVGDHSYWTPDTTHAVKERSTSKNRKKLHRRCDTSDAGSKQDDLRKDGLPLGDNRQTQDILRLVEGEEASRQFKEQQKKDMENKKHGKSDDALPPAEDGDLVALMVTVQKDGKVRYSGVVMETQPVPDSLKMTKVSPEKTEDIVTKNKAEEYIDEDIWNAMHGGATEEECEILAAEKLKILALDFHEKMKMQADEKRLLAREMDMLLQERDMLAREREKNVAVAQVTTKGLQESQPVLQEVSGRSDMPTPPSPSNGHSRSKRAARKKKPSSHSVDVEYQHKPINSPVGNGVEITNGGHVMNGDVKAKGKLRQCANCHVLEASPKMFKKCQKCKLQKVTLASYYCSRECQADDWVTFHKAFHKTYVQP